MKYIPYILLFINLTFSFGQNVERIAYHNNGECEFNLFPEIIKGKIEINQNSDTIKLEINDWIHEINKKYKVTTEELYSGLHKVYFKCVIPIGEQVVHIPYAAFSRCFSKVSFDCTIDIKSNSIIYYFENFYTNRRIVNGTGKSAGESNTLHWYRLNSIKKIKTEYINNHNTKRKKVKETIDIYDDIIQYEEDIYISEYNAVKNIEQSILDYFNSIQK